MSKINGMCPWCYIRKIFGGARVVEKTPTAKAYDNAVQTTPLMGWSSWNTFKNRIDEDLIYDAALALKTSGLLDAGYKYVNLDDNWPSGLRDANGEWQGDFLAFPSGIPALVKKINALGMRVGLYSSNGTLTCEEMPASEGREATDAATLAKWGVEYFKYDFCHNVKVSNYAPLVYGITVNEIGTHERQDYLCSNAILKGVARRMRCSKVDGKKYVSGLDDGKGSMLFENISVKKEGTYALSVNIKKKGLYEKFLLARVNGKDTYEIEFPGQKWFNVTARFQVPVTLHAGVNTVELFNPISNNRDSAALLYQRMAHFLKAATAKVAADTKKPEKPILFSICEWGFRKPWLWGASAGNMWRTTPDINPHWATIRVIYNRNVKLHLHASPSHFNDPDMLEVGNGKLSYDENLSHFALWCMMCSPLVLGNDVRKISKPVLDIVTNKDLIAINQDPLAKQAKRVKRGSIDILAKPLADGSVALCFFNKSAFKKSAKFNFTSLVKDNFVAMAKGDKVMSSIIGESTQVGNKVCAKIPRHGVVVVKLK